MEYKNWLQEQSAEWVEIVRRNSSSNPLSGANLTRLGQGRVLHNHQNSNFQSRATPTTKWSIFTRIKPAVTNVLNPAFKGILGPPPSYLRPSLEPRNFGPAHQHANTYGHPCQTCGLSGHQPGRCGFPPRSSCRFNTPAGNSAPSTDNPSSNHSLQTRPKTGYKEACFASFSDFSKSCLGLSPPPRHCLLEPYLEDHGSRV